MYVILEMRVIWNKYVSLYQNLITECLFTSLPKAINADVGNLYTAQFVLLQKGKYRIRATGRRGNLKLGEDQIDIYAHPQLAELENPQRNEDLLKQLAGQTGGTYFTMADAEAVPENIANVQNPIFVDAERDLWAHPLVLITVVGLLGTEWFLRKRIGLT